MQTCLNFLKIFFKGLTNLQSNSPNSTLLRAQELIAAIDRGGLPLNPMIVNRIGRDLGLEVLPSDPMHITIEKIRSQLRTIK